MIPYKFNRKLVSLFFMRVILVLLMAVIYIEFIYVYKTTISPSYSYYGLKYFSLTSLEYATSFLFGALPLLFLPLSIKRPSDVAIWTLYFTSYLSTMFVRFYVTDSSYLKSTTFFVVLLLCLALMNICRYHPVSPCLRQYKQGGENGKLLFITLFICVVFVACYLSGFTFLVDLSKLYDLRTIARNETLFGHGYILSFGRSVLVVFSVYFFWIYKKYSFLLLLISFSLASFAFDGTKSSILVPIIVLAFAVYFRYTGKLLWVLCAVIILISLSVFEFRFGKSTIISEYLVRRIFAIPGLLNSLYWDFFMGSEKMWLTDSIGRLFFEPVYDKSPSYLIGEVMLPGSGNNANTGIWLGGYAHFGFWGMGIVSVIAGVLLGLIDNLTGKQFFLLGCLACFYIGLKWSEQMLHTSMLSGGVFFLFVCLIYYVHAPCVKFGTKFLRWK